MSKVDALHCNIKKSTKKNVTKNIKRYHSRKQILEDQKCRGPPGPDF